MSKEGQGKIMGAIIAKCWADEAFKQKLLADPTTVLKAEGAKVPAGITVKAMENTDTVFHLVIPAKPSSKLSDDELGEVAGGSSSCTPPNPGNPSCEMDIMPQCQPLDLCTQSDLCANNDLIT